MAQPNQAPSQQPAASAAAAPAVQALAVIPQRPRPQAVIERPVQNVANAQWALPLQGIWICVDNVDINDQVFQEELKLAKERDGAGRCKGPKAVAERVARVERGRLAVEEARCEVFEKYTALKRLMSRNIIAESVANSDAKELELRHKNESERRVAQATARRVEREAKAAYERALATSRAVVTDFTRWDAKLPLLEEEAPARNQQVAAADQKADAAAPNQQAAAPNQQAAAPNRQAAAPNQQAAAPNQQAAAPNQQAAAPNQQARAAPLSSAVPMSIDSGASSENRPSAAAAAAAAAGAPVAAGAARRPAAAAAASSTARARLPAGSTPRANPRDVPTQEDVRRFSP